jgi:multidrug efflux pump subunit AcrA (membrane-fusion protein)
MKKVRRLLIVFAVLFLAACGTGEEAEEEEADDVTTVDVEEVQEGDLTVERSKFGRVAPGSTAPIMLEALGEIEELEVRNGELVEEDDLLAEVSTPAGNQNIRSPKDGVVASLQGSEGDLVSNEEPFAVVADMTSPAVDVSVTKRIHDFLEADDEVTVLIEDEEYEATVTGLDPMPDDTGLYPIELTLAEEDIEEGDLLPGAVAEVIIPEQRFENVLLVPSAAVVTEGDDRFVYTIEDNIVEKKSVTVKETQSDETAIESEDVEAGDQDVTTGQLNLSDGAQVNVAGGE